MGFKPKRLLNLLIPDTYLNGEVLTTVGITKYLGVFIDCDAHDNDDMCQVKVIYAKGNIFVSRCNIYNDDVTSCLSIYAVYIIASYGWIIGQHNLSSRPLTRSLNTHQPATHQPATSITTHATLATVYLDSLCRA